MKNKNYPARSADAVKHLRSNIKTMRGAHKSHASAIFSGTHAPAKLKAKKKPAKSHTRLIIAKAAGPALILVPALLITHFAPPEGFSWLAAGDEVLAMIKSCQALLVVALDTLLI